MKNVVWKIGLAWN